MSWTTPRTWADSPAHDHTQANYQTHITNNLNWLVRPVHISSVSVDIVSAKSGELFADTLPTPSGYTGTAVIPAGYMGSSGCLRGILSGDYLNNTTADVLGFEALLAFGTTTVWKSTTELRLESHELRHDWQLRFEIANLNSPLQQFATGTFAFSHKNEGNAGGTGDLGIVGTDRQGPFVVPFGSQDIISVDTTEDVPVTFTITHKNSPADAQLSFRRFYGSIELIGQAA